MCIVLFISVNMFQAILLIMLVFMQSQFTQSSFCQQEKAIPATTVFSFHTGIKNQQRAPVIQ